MPWYKRLRLGRKKTKKAKREISEPTSFQHCYHAIVDSASGEFVGLPPQWVGLFGSEPPKCPSSSRASSSTVVHVVAQPVETPRAGTTVGFVEPASNGAVTTDEREGDVAERGTSVAREEDSTSRTPASDRSTNSSPVSALTTSRESGSTCTTTSGGRRVPIIRGSDTCLEETIRYIRKHYRSASSASPASFEEDAAREDDQYVDIHCSRSGSLMQLRGGGRAASRTPSNGSPRPSAGPYTSSSTHTMSNTSAAPLSTNAAFCMSAPQDLNVVQSSDFGLYDCEVASASNTTLFRSRIHSPSDSSGYFGSTLSSLCSSRISALSSIQQIPPLPSSTATQPTNQPSAQHHRCSTLHENSEFPWIHPQMRHGQPHFSSLQRPPKFCRGNDNTPHSGTTTRTYTHVNSGSNIAAFASSPPGHYGTAPRTHTHRPRGDSIDSALVGRSYREKTSQHEPPSSRYQYNHGGHTHTNTHHAFSQPHSHTVAPPPTSTQPRNAHTSMNKTRRQQFHLHRRPMMTSEQFRATLELLVNRSDPRRDYCELAKVGEGSTGMVFLAKQVSTGRKVAVKKMNIRRQQRRELLFNEVPYLFR